MGEPLPHPNLDVVNAVYQAMADGDRDRLESLHHPDVVLHVSGHGAHAGDHIGRDAVLGRMAVAGEDAATISTAVHDILWSPEHVVVLLTVTVTREGEELAQNIVQVVHVIDGQVGRIWEYLWDQSHDEVFWSRH